MMPTNATQSTLEKCRPPVVRGLLVVSLVCLMSVTLADVASAQGHPLYRGDMPPGMIGHQDDPFGAVAVNYLEGREKSVAGHGSPSVSSDTCFLFHER